MLTLYTDSGGLPLKCDDYYIRELASGYDELIFTISIWDAAYPLIQEEATIFEQSGDATAPTAYLVKAIDGGKDTATIKAQIDLDEWRGSLTQDYNSGSQTAANIVRSVTPQGWAVVDASGLTNRRTIKLTGATPLDVLEAIRSPWPSLTYRFDTASKAITIINMARGQNLGAYATRDLNLTENNYKGKSTGFITRLYAYGKDGLSFASINGGKPYVDNNDYSDRIICGYWIDERYTVAENLLADATERLAELAKPARSYECSVIDLASISRGKYGFLDFSLFSVVTLIDQTRSGQKIEHRVTERWRYPYYPERNRVMLATVAPRIQSQVQQAINNFNNPNSVWAQQQRSAQEAAIENATSHITGAKGGNMRAIYDSAGNWTELVVMDTDSILTASKLWRFNIGGFGYSSNGYNGPYGTAITMDGAIVADFITVGTLDAALVNVEHLNASNITVGTLSAARIAANSIAVSKLTGSIAGGQNNSWEINLTDGTMTIGTLNASAITTGQLAAARIDATDLHVNAANIDGKLTASQIEVTDLSALGATIGGWTISTTTLNKKSGDLGVYLRAPASPTGTDLAIYVTDTSGGSTSYPFSVRYNGKVTATNAEISGKITATSGVIGGVTIANGTLSGITDTNIAVGGISGGSGGSIAAGTITGGTGGNIASLSISGGNVASSTLASGKFSAGVQADLGSAANYGSATASSDPGTYPTYFTCGNLNHKGSYVKIAGQVCQLLTATINGTTIKYLGYA